MKTTAFETREALDRAFREALTVTDVVLDIGCGLRPFGLFRPRVHLAVEPWAGYLEPLRQRFRTEPGFVPLTLAAPDGLSVLPDKSVDSVYLFDVIEHLEKEDGFRLLREAERLARIQIAVFTPLGFMEQEYATGELDAWGTGNTEFQKHRSGWTPEDFGTGWRTLVCETYHAGDFGGHDTFGAFYAIKNIAQDDLPHLPDRTLVVSNLALPRNVDRDLETFFLGLFGGIDAKSFGVLCDIDYAPYNQSVVFPLDRYATWRLPCEYHAIGRLAPPENFQASCDDGDVEALYERDGGFSERIDRGARLIETFGYRSILYLDKFDTNLLLAIALARRANLPLKVVQLGNELLSRRSAPVVDWVLRQGVLTLQPGALSPKSAAKKIIEFLQPEP